LYLACAALVILLAGMQRRAKMRAEQELAGRRRAEVEERRIKRMIDLSQDAIIVTDRDRRIESWNLGAKEVYGWESAEAAGKVIHILLKSSISAVEKKEQALEQNGWWEGELTHVHKEGREIRCESRQVLLRDAEGQIDGMLEINRDITERKRMEEKLRESAKLESLGVLAGGVAHDFNNLLTGVLGYASLLSDQLPPESKAWSFANQICEAGERAAKLAHQMLAYSGRGQFIIEPVNLSAYVEHTAALIQSSIPKNVVLTFDLAKDPLFIEADLAQLQQLVMNLVINGAEAIGPEGGRVTVATKLQMVDEAYKRTFNLDEDMKIGPYAVLAVSDTGCGMSEEVLPRIFDPFFTTKFVGRGLGLAAVQGIVRGHKGAMEVHSAVGEGTTFRVLLPCSAAAGAAHKAEPPEIQAATAGAGTILVIDDEEVVRSAASDWLRRLGYDVVTASDGTQGLELYRSLNQRIRLVVLDLSMPGISGEETFRELQKIRPDVSVMLSSRIRRGRGL